MKPPGLPHAAGPVTVPAAGKKLLHEQITIMQARRDKDMAKRVKILEFITASLSGNSFAY